MLYAVREVIRCMGPAGGLWLPEMVDLAGGCDEAQEPGAPPQMLTWDQVGLSFSKRSVHAVAAAPYPFHSQAQLYLRAKQAMRSWRSWLHVQDAGNEGPGN